MRRMLYEEKRFFRALLLMQTLYVLVTGIVFLNPVALVGLALFAALDIALAFTRAGRLLATTACRLTLVVGCVLLPLILVIRFAPLFGMPVIEKGLPNNQIQDIGTNAPNPDL